jgi:aminocarboxymuconate-semialdehyde decarboxylase
MIRRRDLLSAGIAFCSCTLLAGAGLPSLRQAVKVNGRRVKTIDVHAHCYIPDAIALLDPPRLAKLRALSRASIRDQMLLAPARASLEHRLRVMDAQAIDMEVLSINPFWYGEDRDLAMAIVTLQNDRLAELCGAYPDRFAAFATLPLQFPDLAVAELDRAVRDLGLRGVAIGGHVAGVPFSDSRFHPIWAKAQDLAAMLIIHPTGLDSAELDAIFAGAGALDNAIGNPLETTIALSHLIFEGTLDLFPDLKVCAAHGGGYLPSYAGRSDQVCRLSGPRCDAAVPLKRKPSEYLRSLYYDSLVFTPEALRHLVAEVGASQIMIGTDTPHPWQPHPVDHVMATASLTPQQKIAILGGNAARLLRL